MKYSAVIAMLPRLLSAGDAADYCCTESMLNHLRADYGLRPIEEKRGSVIYDREDIDACINRKKAANAGTAL